MGLISALWCITRGNVMQHLKYYLITQTNALYKVCSFSMLPALSHMTWLPAVLRTRPEQYRGDQRSWVSPLLYQGRSASPERWTSSQPPLDSGRGCEEKDLQVSIHPSVQPLESNIYLGSAMWIPAQPETIHKPWRWGFEWSWDLRQERARPHQPPKPSKLVGSVLCSF